MKTWKIVLISLGGTFLILAFFLIVPVIIMDQPWAWFYVPSIFFGVVGLMIGIIFFVIKLNKPKPTQVKIDIKSAKARVIHDMKYDEDNPDNFKIQVTQLRKIGERGTEKTPVGVFFGVGTETNESRVAIVNLNNPKKETTFLTDPQKEEVDRMAIFMAENQPEEVKEETTTTIGAFGQPITTTKTSRPNTTQQKIEKEKEEADKANAI